MLEGFDELYDKFFDNKKKLDDLIDRLNKFENKKKLDDLIDRLKNFEEIKLSKECELGGIIEPDEMIGIKVIKLREKPLETQLDDAVNNEEYEKAANIRDLIAKRDSKIKNKKNKK
jgi:hypothetical protein